MNITNELIPFAWRQPDGTYYSDMQFLEDGIGVISAVELLDDPGRYVLLTVESSPMPRLDPDPYVGRYVIADVTTNSPEDGGETVYWYLPDGAIDRD